MEENKFKEGFSRGWRKIRIEDVAEVKKRLYEVLDTEQRATWARYLNGSIEPKASVAYNIEMVFADYGIHDVWGK